ncbi:MAG: hypothetical protein GX146_07050 [Myxococcales bacterium]|jgi:membrane dipeptidase|nr:hypothetical protein [Myxococcales bacterium]
MFFRTLAALMALSLAWNIGCACSKKKDDPTASMDLVGTSQPPPAPAAASPEPPAASAPSDSLTVDLIHDLIFRLRRDRWTLHTPEADVNLTHLGPSGLNLLFAALPVDGDAQAALRTGLADLRTLLDETDGRVQLVDNMSQVAANAQRGVVSVMVMLEGADGLGRMNTSDLQALRATPVQVVNLLSPKGNDLGGLFGSTPGTGLTPKGIDWVQNAREAGIAISLTMAAEATFWDVLVDQGILAMVSHSACRHLREHPRNLTDLQILALARYGGLLGIVFNPDFIRAGDAPATIDDVVQHFAHVRRIGATDALAIGSDFNGILPPTGLRNVAALPTLRQRLRQEGFSDAELRAVFGENARRYFEAVETRQGSAEAASGPVLRPIATECDSATGEYTGALPQACDHYLRTPGPVLQPSARHRFRISDMTRTPIKLELFGVPKTPWQIEGQNLEGKVLIRRSVLLDDDGHGEIPMPSNQKLTRFFLFPTRPSHLDEAVLWGR